MSRPNTWLNSKVSPVLIRCAARSTLAGVMWLPEPRSSVAPHFDGQRSLGDGGCQLCAVASALKAERPKTMTMARLFMAFLPFALRRSKRALPRVHCPSDNRHKRGDTTPTLRATTGQQSASQSKYSCDYFWTLLCK